MRRFHHIYDAEDGEYYRLKQVFSKLYDTWPTKIVTPILPLENANDTCFGLGEANAIRMKEATKFLENAVKQLTQCKQPFTLRSGGHGNAGQGEKTPHLDPFDPYATFLSFLR